MSKNSDNVKNWRKTTKSRIILAMGGSCCLCGYNKCNSALALHHLDPSQKDFSIASVRANIKSWNSIVQELTKCILVCHNCHSEIHSGIVSIPPNVNKFDEKYIDYKTLFKEETLCICGKTRINKFCSKECYVKSKYKVDWDKVNLQEELKNKTVVQLAKELNCSDTTIHKRIKKLLISSTAPID